MGTDATRLQCLFDRPAVTSQAVAKRLTIDARLFRPLCNSLCFASKRDQCSLARVSHLLLLSCPPAILRTIIAIIIFTIQRSSGRAVPHISHEICKVFPAATYRDAPATVILPGRISRIGASLPHFRPDRVVGVLSQPVRSCYFSSDDNPQTAAGLGVSVSKIEDGDASVLAAVTVAQPHGRAA